MAEAVTALQEALASVLAHPERVSDEDWRGQAQRALTESVITQALAERGDSG
jgi:hypothetical protein